MTRAYYSETISNFIHDDSKRILGNLAEKHPFPLEDLQKNAWIDEIEILKRNVGTIKNGYILFEYSIPRMGKRVDVVLLVRGIVIVIEFKVGDTQYSSHAMDQVIDYALDLKNFHEQSHKRPIIPVVVATEANEVQNSMNRFGDGVYSPLKANKQNLGQILSDIMNSVSASDIDPIAWCDSIYKPTPTIIEAAQALYRGHSVKEISRSDAGAINLSRTAEAISEIIEYAKTNHKKVICFVTGVPGSGKTLAGLNIANERLQINQDEHAVFLSGNGPLVRVLREALVRNELENSSQISKKKTKKKTKKSISPEVRAFIQNIHHFRDYALEHLEPPIEKVVVFDEAQRAWTLEKTADFMKRKRNDLNFSMSEPRFLISIMDRHPDWAVIICLIGGGQEINTGEAGLLEWFKAIKEHYAHWRVSVSPNLTEGEYTKGEDITRYFVPDQLSFDQRLHLSVSIRSFRAENVSNLVKAVLDNDLEKAKILRSEIDQRYPIVITRDIDKAKKWLKAKARGTERYGLLASSGAMRLRPIGINVQSEIDVVNWFLNGKEDIRSSYYLEDVGTEFDVQGLELDWTGVAWDADLRYSNGDWDYKSFRGTKWQNINAPLLRDYLKNAYRVLLTRARQGMVIVVPQGNMEDITRKPEFYDETYRFLEQIGFQVL